MKSPQISRMPRNLSFAIHRWAALAVCFLGVVQAADSEQWLTYPGKSGPGKGKRVILMAADQEYRSEQSMPMLAKILSQHHGFDCTVLFAVNEKGEVDPTMPVYPEKGKPFHEHHIPGLELLAKADLVLFFPRLLTLPMKERERSGSCGVLWRPR